MNRIQVVLISLLVMSTSSALAQVKAETQSAPSALIASPASPAPLTRADVKAQIKALRAAGYDVNRFDLDYPVQTNEANARLADMRRARAMDGMPWDRVGQ